MPRPEYEVIVKSMETRQRELGAIAELALTSRDQAAFRAALTDRLGRLIGFELASFNSVHATGVAMWMRGYDTGRARARIHDYMLELAPHEIAAATGERPMVDTDVIPRRRREQLALYREQLWPHGVSVFTTAMWRDRDDGFGFHLARTGRGSRFRPREIEALASVLPAIKLAESYICARERSVGGAVRTFSAWADELGLTAAERRVAELVARGMQNREIAALLGVSPLTVRNQLGSVFRKADVSTRAELAFVCSNLATEGRDPAEPRSWSSLFHPRSAPPRRA